MARSTDDAAGQVPVQGQTTELRGIGASINCRNSRLAPAARYAFASAGRWGRCDRLASWLLLGGLLPAIGLQLVRPGRSRDRRHPGRLAGMTVSLHHSGIDSHDLAAQARFWCRVLNWEVLSEREREVVIGPGRECVRRNLFHAWHAWEDGRPRLPFRWRTSFDEPTRYGVVASDLTHPTPSCRHRRDATVMEVHLTLTDGEIISLSAGAASR